MTYSPRILLTLITLCLLPGGCQLPAAIIYKVAGPPPIPARYTPPATEPMLVLVEGAQSPVGSIPEADELAQALQTELKANNVAPLVEPGAVHDLRHTNPAAYSKLGIAEIGRKAGAKQVLYVSLRQVLFENPPGSDSVKLTVSARVKMVDAQSAVTVWPQSGNEEYYDYQSPFRRITPDISANSLKREILTQCGSDIARWFYAYQPQNMREENREERLR